MIMAYNRGASPENCTCNHNKLKQQPSAGCKLRRGLPYLSTAGGFPGSGCVTYRSSRQQVLQVMELSALCNLKVGHSTNYEQSFPHKQKEEEDGISTELHFGTIMLTQELKCLIIKDTA